MVRHRERLRAVVVSLRFQVELRRYEASCTGSDIDVNNLYRKELTYD
jgi:hypothetical protein